MSRLRFAALLVGAGACLGPAWSVASAPAARTPAAHTPVTLFDEDGYRQARYRAPVDREPAPAQRLDGADAVRLVPGRDALFIDVLPVNSGWRDPATGIWSLSQPHASIPGAQWHPETGRNHPPDDLWNALIKSIAMARALRSDMPVVLFCRTDCWMGWNAARRLASQGHAQIYWYADGIEGWRASGQRLEEVRPVTVPQE